MITSEFLEQSLHFFTGLQNLNFSNYLLKYYKIYWYLG